jgi:pimeloyl-ACP methyl ester carboxylesterase
MTSKELTATGHLGRISAQAWGEETEGTVLLVPGITLNSADWPRSLITKLVNVGYRVVALDLPDTGRSDRTRKNYDLQDLALATFEFSQQITRSDNVHWVGLSMGSLILSLLPFEEEPAKSLTLMMTATGSLVDGWGQPAMISKLLGVRHDREEELFFQLYSLRSELARGGSEYEQRELRNRIHASIERGKPFNGGPRRQSTAVSKHFLLPSAGLHPLAPSPLIIHGGADPLLPIKGARALHRRWPGSRLLVIPSMGHEILEGHVSEIGESLISHFRSTSLTAEKSPLRAVL